MGNITSEQEYELRKEDIRIKLEELEIRKRDSRRARWANPMFVAMAAALVAFFGQYLVREQARIQSGLQAERDKKQFCYRAIADFLDRANSASSAKAARELTAVVEALDLRTECNGDLRELSDLFSSPSIPLAESSAGSGPAQQPIGACARIASIRDLGWSHGHKTNFCKARGYDSVQNPFGEYSAGGYCYSGDIEACTAKIQSALK